MPNKSTTLQQLQSSASALTAEIERLPSDAVLWRPKDGEWSVHECLTHLRDIECLVFLPRIRRTIQEDRPALELFDESTYHREHWDGSEPLAAVLNDYTAARAEIVSLLEAASDWSRQGLHPARGPQTLLWQAEYAIGHTWEHLSQIMRVRLSHELTNR